MMWYLSDRYVFINTVKKKVKGCVLVWILTRNDIYVYLFISTRAMFADVFR